uniref:HMA domain-containing protein n=1 Tax=Desulfovibrio sp. U5L TaxID=596152 RepID=I2Q2G8_9BACT
MIASCIEGRLRLRHPALTDATLLREVAEQVAALPGITGVDANPRTGSLLVTHDDSIATADLVALAEQYAASRAEALAAAPAKPAGRKEKKKPNVAKIKRRTQKIGLATCMAGAVATGLADTKAAHLVFGLGLAGFAAWHLTMYRRRFLA